MAQGVNGIRIDTLASPELAFIGDAVWNLTVKTALLERGVRGSNSLSGASSLRVSAPVQAAFMERILPALTPQEASVVNRGKNARLPKAPKNSTPVQYKLASALECLFGWLYVSGDHERIRVLADAFFSEET